MEMNKKGDTTVISEGRASLSLCARKEGGCCYNRYHYQKEKREMSLLLNNGIM